MPLRISAGQRSRTFGRCVPQKASAVGLIQHSVSAVAVAGSINCAEILHQTVDNFLPLPDRGDCRFLAVPPKQLTLVRYSCARVAPFICPFQFPILNRPGRFESPRQCLRVRVNRRNTMFLTLNTGAVARGPMNAIRCQCRDG